VEKFGSCLWKILWKTPQGFLMSNLNIYLILPRKKIACGKLKNSVRKKIFKPKKMLGEAVFFKIFVKNNSKIEIVTEILRDSPIRFGNLRQKKFRCRRITGIGIFLKN